MIEQFRSINASRPMLVSARRQAHRVSFRDFPGAGVAVWYRCREAMYAKED